MKIKWILLERTMSVAFYLDVCLENTVNYNILQWEIRSDSWSPGFSKTFTSWQYSKLVGHLYRQWVTTIKYCIRVREIHFSLARHFVRQTSSPLPDILNYSQTFYCKKSGEYQTFRWWSICQTLSLIYSRRKFCTATSDSLAGHLSKFARHVRQFQQILHTLKYQLNLHHSIVLVHLDTWVKHKSESSPTK